MDRALVDSSQVRASGQVDLPEGERPVQN